MNALRIHRLGKSFGTQRIVDGLDLVLGAGEIVALLGPSGCGKTTALRMVAGLERPDAGEISIGERMLFGPATDLPPEHRRVGMVFQSYAVWPHRNVFENVAYPLELRREADIERRVLETLERVHLGGFAKRRPDTLSGGQQQRVALARALVAEPELLLFDEPLSNLDAKLREEMRHEIRELTKRAGTTSLYVTHDQAEAFAVSDRVAVVMGGRVAQIADPVTLYAEPVSLAVAGFVGRISSLRVDRREASFVSLGGAQVPLHVGEPSHQTAVVDATGKQDWVVAVRPEHVHIDSEGAIAGRIVRATYLGDRYEALIATDFGDLRVDLPATKRPTPSENVRLRILQGRAFPGEAS